MILMSSPLGLRRSRRAVRRAGGLAGRRGIEHLYLTGCGDSAFAGLGGHPGVPAAQPAARACAARARPRPVRGPVPAAAPARCWRSRSPARSAARRRPRAGGRVRPSGDRADGQRRRAAGRRRRPDPARRRAHARLLARHQHLHRHAVHADRACAADRTRPAGRAILAARDQLPGQAAKTLDWCDSPAAEPAARMASGAVRDVPRRRAERGHGAVRGREAVRGIAADRGRHEHGGVGARGVLHYQAAGSGRRGRADRAGLDRALEILSELQFVGADATVVSDTEPPGRPAI